MEASISSTNDDSSSFRVVLVVLPGEAKALLDRRPPSRRLVLLRLPWEVGVDMVK